MDELTLKLKKSVISELLSNEQLIDEPYLVAKSKKWSRREIAKEIQNETDFGIKQLTNILLLSLDLFARNTTTGKEFLRDEEIKELLK